VIRESTALEAASLDAAGVWVGGVGALSIAYAAPVEASNTADSATPVLRRGDETGLPKSMSIMMKLPNKTNARTGVKNCR
jgi:hypothetical protein